MPPRNRTMKADSPGPSTSAIAFISSPSSPPTLVDRNDFITSFVNDIGGDLTLDLNLMPHFFNIDSPSSSSLSTPTTQTSFEDSQSSIFSYTSSVTTVSSLSSDKVAPYVDAFLTHSPTQSFIDDSIFTTPFIEIKQEPPFFVNEIESFGSTLDMAAYVSFDYKHPDSMHRMNELSVSPQLTSPTFTHLESYERTPAVETVRPYQHSLPVFHSPYASSSDESVNDLPPPAPLPKKPYRVPKQDKGIKCDHCGVDKTPLWRKVPNKDNAYHCNACGLYYKSNGHFRETEGETRVVRSKKPRKVGDLHLAHSFRSGPVTANRNLSCANCHTNTTVLWRKGPDGQSPLCNPCGLFYKLHGTHRSPEKKKEIHRRNRTGKKRFSISTEKSTSWSSAEEGDDEESPVNGEFGFRRASVSGGQLQPQPQQQQQQQQPQQQQQSFVKMEGREFTASQGVNHLPNFMGQPQYPYQWQGQSVQGRC